MPLWEGHCLLLSSPFTQTALYQTRKRKNQRRTMKYVSLHHPLNFSFTFTSCLKKTERNYCPTWIAHVWVLKYYKQFSKSLNRANERKARDIFDRHTYTKTKFGFEPLLTSQQNFPTQLQVDRLFTKKMSSSWEKHQLQLLLKHHI